MKKRLKFIMMLIIKRKKKVNKEIKDNDLMLVRIIRR